MSGVVLGDARITDEGRTCRGCGLFLPWGKFAKKSNGINGKRSRCAPCQTRVKYAWIDRNRERHDEYVASWRESGRALAAMHRYIERNPELVAHRAAQRQGRTGDGRYTRADWRRLLQRFDGMCAYCQAHPAKEREHVVPLSRGGKNWIGNILPVCPLCNRSKGALTIMEWRLSGRAPEALRPITNRRYTDGC